MPSLCNDADDDGGGERKAITMVLKMIKSSLYLEMASKIRFFIKSVFGLVRKVISLVSVLKIYISLVVVFGICIICICEQGNGTDEDEARW